MHRVAIVAVALFLIVVAAPAASAQILPDLTDCVYPGITIGIPPVNPHVYGTDCITEWSLLERLRDLICGSSC